MLIRSLQLDGTARIAGQPIELRGVLMNLSSAPRLHNEPMRLHLVGNGSLPLELQATIDRTGISGARRIAGRLPGHACARHGTRESRSIGDVAGAVGWFAFGDV